MTEKPKYYNQARNRASQKYQKENLEQIAIRVPKGDRAALKAAAEAAGESMALYIINSVNIRAGREVLTIPNSKAEPQPKPIISQGEAELFGWGAIPDWVGKIEE